MTEGLLSLNFWEMSMIQRMVMNFCLLVGLLLSGRYLDLQVAIKLPLSSLEELCVISYVLFLRFLGTARQKRCLSSMF